MKSCLSKSALYAYECHLLRGGTDAEIVNAIERSLEAEAANVDDTWSSMPQICALASVIEADVNVVYTDIDKQLSSFFHTTVKRLISTQVDSKASISITWSSVAAIPSKEGFVHLTKGCTSQPLCSTGVLDFAAQRSTPIAGSSVEPQPRTNSSPRKNHCPSICKSQQLKLGDFFKPKVSKQKPARYKNVWIVLTLRRLYT